MKAMALRGLDSAHRLAAILERAMKGSLARLVATLVLSGQLQSAGLPLLCNQARQGTRADCAQQMQSTSSGPAIGAATQSTPCANPVLCATAPTGALTLSAAVSVSARESHIVTFRVATFDPADPQPPLPPPPQA